MKQLMILLGLATLGTVSSTCAAENPNILWIVAEDMSPDLGCYGNQLVTTPHLDQLAAGGMRFDRVFVTGPACSPSRTALATGLYQTRLGACHMRYPVPLLADIRILPELMRDNGYTTGNLRNVCGTGTGKDDWIFTTSQQKWDTDSWEELTKHQPFFGQINFSESHRGFSRNSRHTINPDEVRLPPYYPDHPVAREDWAGYLMEVNTADEHVGRILARLEADGLAENTIVVFLSDHGRPMIRAKNWLYDSGTHIPLIIHYPPQLEKPARFQAGSSTANLISSIDLVVETLIMAGGEVPSPMQGRSFLRRESVARNQVMTAVDIVGDIESCSRAVRSERYKYIRNYKQPGSVNSCTTAYRRATHPIYHLLNILGERQQLGALQRQLLEPLAAEELYDLQTDPHETKNLVGRPEIEGVRRQLSKALEDWVVHSEDRGIDGVDDELRQAAAAYGAATFAKQQKSIDAMRVAVERRSEDHIDN